MCLAVLNGPLYIFDRIARDDAHQNGARGFAAPRPSDQQTTAAQNEVQQRQQHKARIALIRRQNDAAFLIAESEYLRRPVIIFDVIIRTDDGVIDYPEISLTEFFIERRIYLFTPAGA